MKANLALYQEDLVSQNPDTFTIYIPYTVCVYSVCVYIYNEDLLFGSLSCWTVKFFFIFTCLTVDCRFCAKIDLELYMIPSILTRAPAEEKQDTATTMLHKASGLVLARNICFRIVPRNF